MGKKRNRGEKNEIVDDEVNVDDNDNDNNNGSSSKDIKLKHKKDDDIEEDIDEEKRVKKKKRKMKKIESDENDGIENENEKGNVEISKEKNYNEDIDNNQGDYQVYVEGIPYSMDETSITNLFSKCGKIVSFNLPRWHDSNKIRGYAHIGYSTENERNEAISKFDGFETGGRYLSVQLAKGKNLSKSLSFSKQPGNKSTTPPKGCKILFVKNLPYDTNDAAVKELFNKYGKVESIRLAKWKQTENLKGFGYITFQSENDLLNTIKKNKNQGFILSGRKLAIDFETEKSDNKLKQ